MTLPQRYFDELYAQAEDPWYYRERWYEQRKRAITLAALPRARFASGYEPGCAVGELSAALAARCDRLLASDGAPVAVERAGERLRGYPNVRVEHRQLPWQWPRQRFDLIVFSELGYYFDEASLAQVADALHASLDDGGVLLACHWRHPIEHCALDGDAVHRLLQARLGLPRLSRHEEEDFLLEVWSVDGASVACREGLV